MPGSTLRRKDAFATATSVESAGPLLNRLFHWAFGVGKRVRSETGLAEGAVSVSFAAVNLARKIFGQLAGAYYGVAGIPARWVRKIAMCDKIERLALDLLHKSGLST